MICSRGERFVRVHGPQKEHVSGGLSAAQRYFLDAFVGAGKKIS